MVSEETTRQILVAEVEPGKVKLTAVEEDSPQMGNMEIGPGGVSLDGQLVMIHIITTYSDAAIEWHHMELDISPVHLFGPGHYEVVACFDGSHPGGDFEIIRSSFDID